MKRLTYPIATLLAAVGVAAFAAAGCGSSHKPASSVGNAVDRAFAAEMTMHHQGALEMAQMAKQRAQHREIRTLANSILSTQTAEISQLKAIGEQMGAKSSDHGADHSDGGGMAMHGGGTSAANLTVLGLSADQAGMNHDMHMLEMAKPFDRAFVDMMVPHHQGAIRMARIELARGKNPKLKSLSQAIIDAQSREITQMSSWRRGWYGSASPTGGVPA